MGNSNPAAKIDFADVLLEMDVDDPEDANGILKIIQQINKILPLLALFGIDPKDIMRRLLGRIGGGNLPTVPVKIPTAPVVVAPPKDDVDVPPPAPGPRLSIDRFRVDWFWFERRGGQGAVRKEVFDQILSGEDSLQEKNRACGDCDPLDARGNEIELHDVNHPEAIRLFTYPAYDTGTRDGAPRARTQRMRWYIEGGDGVAGVVKADGNAMNPIIKVGRLEENRNYSTGFLFGVYEGPDGRTIETPRFPALRCNPTN